MIGQSAINRNHFSRDNVSPPIITLGHPIISNFTVENGQPTRVYFNSSEVITATTFTGFEIEGYTISDVEIAPGFTTGHYFTIDLALNFWDNILIRYEGGSNLEDLDSNPLYNFTLRYVENKIDEPTTSNTYFVATDGLDTNNGTSSGTPWKTINKASTTVGNDSTVYIKAGDYGNENVVFTNNGLVGAPIKLIGYEITEGDNPTLTRSIGMSFNSSKMPLLKNGTGDAITVKNYIIIRNIQIENYSSDAVVLGNNLYQLIDNVYMTDCEHGTFLNLADQASHQMVINSFAQDMTAIGIVVGARASRIDNCWSVTSKASDMDYYLNINGSDIVGHSYNSSIRNSYVNRFIGDSHTGHGISLQARWNDIGTTQRLLKYALVENNEVWNCTNGAVELRYSGVSHNVVRNVVMGGEAQYDNYTYNFAGLTFNEDAHHNTVEQCTVRNTELGIKFKDSTNDFIPEQSGGNDNRVLNCIFDDVKTMFESNAPLVNQRNLFANCTFNNIKYFFTKTTYTDNGGLPTPPDNWLDNTNEFRNCIFSEIENKLLISNPQPLYNYSDFYSSNSGDWSYTAEAGTANINVNPNFIGTTVEPQNVLLKAGLATLGLEYDRNSVERADPPTMGALEIV